MQNMNFLMVHFVSWVYSLRKFEIFCSFFIGETEGFISPCLHPTRMSSYCGLDRAWSRDHVVTSEYDKWDQSNSYNVWINRDTLIIQNDMCSLVSMELLYLVLKSQYQRIWSLSEVCTHQEDQYVCNSSL